MNHETEKERLSASPDPMQRLGSWISVGDYLPKPKTPCLTFTTQGRVQIRQMNAHKFSEFGVNKVTHWMPLPKPPNAIVTGLAPGKD